MVEESPSEEATPDSEEYKEALQKFSSEVKPLTQEEIEAIVNDVSGVITNDQHAVAVPHVDADPDSEDDDEDEDPTGILRPQGTKKSSSWLVNYCRNRIAKRRPLNIIFLGETGSGKSYSAMKLASIIDPTVTAERIVFSIPDFLALLNSEPPLPRGAVIIFDEAGLGVNSRMYKDAINIVFSQVAQSMRYRGYIVFYTTPKLSFIDAQVRPLLQMIIESTEERGLMKPLFIKPNADRNDPRPWFKYPVITQYKNYTRSILVVKKVRFTMPPKRLYIPYEERKDRFLRSKYVKDQERVTQMLESKDEKIEQKKMEDSTEEGIRLKCPTCAFVFQYKKPKWDPKCPRCGKTIKIPAVLRPYVGLIHPKNSYDY